MAACLFQLAFLLDSFKLILLSRLEVSSILQAHHTLLKVKSSLALILSCQAAALSLSAAQKASSTSIHHLFHTFSFRLMAYTSESSFSNSLAILEAMVDTL